MPNQHLFSDSCPGSAQCSARLVNFSETDIKLISSKIIIFCISIYLYIANAHQTASATAAAHAAANAAAVAQTAALTAKAYSHSGVSSGYGKK